VGGGCGATGRRGAVHGELGTEEGARSMESVMHRLSLRGEKGPRAERVRATGKTSGGEDLNA